MCVFVDPRQGSGELVPYFRPYGVEVREEKLEISNPDGGSESLGDVAFWGNGEDEDGDACEVAVGIERKRVADLVSSMRSGRLSGHQLNGLCSHYDFVFILVEGMWRCGKGGGLEVMGGLNGKGKGKPRWRPVRAGGSTFVLYREVVNYLTTLKLKAGTQAGNRVIVDHTGTKEETVAWVVGLYKWFTEKTWNQHRAHEEIYAPYHKGVRKRGRPFIRRSVGITEKMASQVPGLGQGAYEAGRVFKSPRGLVNAGVEDWRKLRIEQDGKKGKRVVKMGKKRAEGIVRLMEEG